MIKTKMMKVLSAILATAVLMGSAGTVSATGVQTNEIESNNESTQATAITVNQPGVGVLGESGDVDWYKVTTTETGYMQLKFDIDYATYFSTIGGGFEFEIYNSQFHKIYETDFKKVPFVSSNPLPYEPGTFYIRVAGTYAYAATGIPYSITLQQVVSDAWEQEENNTQQTANTIKLDKKYTGVILNSDDIDWYQFKLSKDSTVKIDFGRGDNLTIEQVEGIRSGWDMYIYRASDSKEVAAVKHITEKADNFTVNLKKGTYYVKVWPNASYWCVMPDVPYNFKFTAAPTPAKTKIQKATGKKKAVTITWKKVAGADGYYVYRSTSKNGTDKKIATVKGASKTSYTNNKLKSKKTYYYKVAAYNKTNGVTAIANQSVVKSAKTK